MNNIPKYIDNYNPLFREKASSLRKNSTKAEINLWTNVLKSGKLLGLKFNRQKPLLKYIVDFFCKDLNLIIEVDGNTHNLQEVITKDIIRQKELEYEGFTFIRLNENDINKNIEGVKRYLELTIGELIERKKCLI
jgi:very-short-patch-repair endonuclease